ncbi:MAG: lytic transglycosylase domain-containing protein, partial [Leptospiraceae bacterium]|nr:lytic transglycosylase domain-containing protein [Leptospiraceae bacterium]
MQKFDQYNAVPQLKKESQQPAEMTPGSEAGQPLPRQASNGNPSHFQKILNALIDEKSEDYGISPDLVRAVMQTESAGNPDAVSPAGAQGLMQLMPDTARALGVDPTDPVQNLDGGIRYL